MSDEGQFSKPPLHLVGGTATGIGASTPPLKGGGPGGTSGDMDERVKRLEADVADARKTLTDLRIEVVKGFGDLKAPLATIEERTRHLPTRWEVATIVFAVLALCGVIAGLLRYLNAGS